MSQVNATTDSVSLSDVASMRAGAGRWAWLGAAAVAFGVFGAAWAGAGEPTGAGSLLASLGGGDSKTHARTSLGELAELERAAATAPSTAASRALVLAYLERDQPGLAQAALEHLPLELRYTPEAQHLEARVLLRRGRAREALAAARTAVEGCDRAAPGACPAHVAARATLQVGYLEELVAAGIDDPEASPDATRQAYERGDRSARLVAMR